MKWDLGCEVGHVPAFPTHLLSSDASATRRVGYASLSAVACKMSAERQSDRYRLVRPASHAMLVRPAMPD